MINFNVIFRFNFLLLSWDRKFTNHLRLTLVNYGSKVVGTTSTIDRNNGCNHIRRSWLQVASKVHDSRCNLQFNPGVRSWAGRRPAVIGLSNFNAGQICIDGIAHTLPRESRAHTLIDNESVMKGLRARQLRYDQGLVAACLPSIRPPSRPSLRMPAELDHECLICQPVNYPVLV
jgi:hypothetical protein